MMQNQYKKWNKASLKRKITMKEIGREWMAENKI
jgi:hypothetical protein